MSRARGELRGITEGWSGRAGLKTAQEEHRSVIGNCPARVAQVLTRAGDRTRCVSNEFITISVPSQKTEEDS